MQIVDKVEGKNVDIILNKVVEGDQDNLVPAQLYNIVLHNTEEVVGSCDARIGYNDNIYYGGHLGFYISPEYRGNGYAVEAVNLLKKVFKANKINMVIITNNIDNKASIRVCEKLGAKFLKLVELPENNSQRIEDGEIYKNIWELKF